MKSWFFLVLIVLSATLSLAVSQESEESQKNAVQKREPIKKVSSQSGADNKDKSKNSQPIFLTKKFYKAKVKKEVLKLKFTAHLSALKKNCNLAPEERILELEKKIKGFTQFLREHLKDPNMDYELALLFGDVLSLMELKNLKTPEDFDRAYKLLYNVGELVKPEAYYHEWAKVIYKNIKCSKVI